MCAHFFPKLIIVFMTQELLNGLTQFSGGCFRRKTKGFERKLKSGGPPEFPNIDSLKFEDLIVLHLETTKKIIISTYKPI